MSGGPAQRGVSVLFVTAAAVAAFMALSSARGVLLAREEALGLVAGGGH